MSAPTATSKRIREWTIKASGGRMGWPALILRAEKKMRGNPNTFTTIDIEGLDYDGYEGAHVALPLAQARELLALLPEAIAFIERKKTEGERA